MEKKLCAMEAESRGLRDAMKEAAQKHSDEMKKQEERVSFHNFSVFKNVHFSPKAVLKVVTVYVVTGERKRTAY